MMAAGKAAEAEAKVLLLEKMERPCKKILISGQTRCNVTNSKELDDFIITMGPNGRFLYGAFHHYFRDDLLAFLKRYGVETKTEADGRIFPASDNAGDVTNALREYTADHKVQLITDIRATGIKVEGIQVTGVQTDKGAYPAAAVILATGGASYPGTGSSGDGYKIAAALGHTLVRLRPSLVPLIVHETELVKSMQGVSLHDVRLTAYKCQARDINNYPAQTGDCGRGTGHGHPPHPIIASRRGDIIFAHFGISGPLTLQTSLAIVDAMENGPVSVSIDIKPEANEKELDQQLQQEFDQHGKRSYRHILDDLLPHKMVQPFAKLTGIPQEKRANQLSAQERKRLVNSLKSLCFTIKGHLPLDSAMVTAGGVSLDEVDPRTMASRLIKGLYFCGEVLDLDGDTGGYNLQAAFSTGYVAGEQAATFIHTAHPQNM